MKICKTSDLIVPRCIPLSITRGTNNYESNIGVMLFERAAQLSQAIMYSGLRTVVTTANLLLPVRQVSPMQQFCTGCCA